MILTPRVMKAITFATLAHKDQKRKAQDVPYIVHPFGVAMLLAHYGAEEDVVIAGLLHDTLEDTPTTKDDIEKQFGKQVLSLVTWETEEDKSLPWADRKRKAMDQLRQAPIEAKAIKAADATYNMRDMIEGYKRDGEKFWENFKKGKSDQISRMAALVSLLRSFGLDGIAFGLKRELEETFDELAQLF